MSGLDRVRLRLDRVRAAVGGTDRAFLDTPALPCAPLGRVLGTETVAAAAREEGERRAPESRAGAALRRLTSGHRRHRRAARTANPLKPRQIAALGAEERLERAATTGLELAARPRTAGSTVTGR